MNRTRSLLVACALALGFPMSAQAETQIIEGNCSAPTTAPSNNPRCSTIANPRPVSIFVGDTGSLQARRGFAFEAGVSGMFFPPGAAAPAANFWYLRVKGGAANNVTFGPHPRETPVARVSNALSPGSAWTAESPARVDTVMRIQHGGVDLFEVKQTTLYVAPELRFRVIWDVRNLTAEPIPFIFGTAADLFIESDAGEGVFVEGPPRFIGGRNRFCGSAPCVPATSGAVGGVEQVTSSQIPGEAAATAVPPWASWEEGDPFPVTRRLATADAFLNTINPAFMDNGVGVSFSDRATTGLAAGATARYEVIWHVQRTAVTASGPPPAANLEPVTREAAVPPPPGPGSDAGATAAAPAAAAKSGPADSTAPVLSALRLSPAAATSSSTTAGTRSVRSPQSAPKIVFRLSERASVVLRIMRRAAGRRMLVKKLTRRNLPRGSNVVRIGGRRLAPGSYVVSVRPIDTAGNAGAQRSAAFRVVRR